MTPPKLPPPISSADTADRREFPLFPIILACALTIIVAFVLVLALIPRAHPPGESGQPNPSTEESAGSETAESSGSVEGSAPPPEQAVDADEVVEQVQKDVDPSIDPVLSEPTEPSPAEGKKEPDEEGYGDTPSEPIIPPATSIATIPLFSGRGAEFFGIRQPGNAFAFVIDRSSSMAQGDVMEASSRYALACDELVRCLKRMEPKQRFSLFVYNDSYEAPPSLQDCLATAKNTSAAESYLHMLVPMGGTDPTSALLSAISLKVDGIFIVSDGEFDPRFVMTVVTRNRDKIPIHSICIGFDAYTLQELSARTGGQYRCVK